MSNKKLFTKIIFLVLILSMSIFSTSCSFFNNLFNELTDEEWALAMNKNNFTNVTLDIGDHSVKIVDGLFYDNGDVLKNDGTDVLIRVIVNLFENCGKDSFNFFLANTYSCSKIAYSFDFVADEIGDGLDVTISAEATDIVIEFDSNKKVKTLICDLSFTIIGDQYEKSMGDLRINAQFSDYGTTVV